MSGGLKGGTGGVKIEFVILVSVETGGGLEIKVVGSWEWVDGRI